MDLDIQAERRKGVAREQLDTLCLVKVAGMGKQHLEAFLILCKFEERGSAERRVVAQVEQLLEPMPQRSSLVCLDADIPHLRPSSRL